MKDSVLMAGLWGGRLEKDHMARLRVEEEKAESALYYNNPLAQLTTVPGRLLLFLPKGDALGDLLTPHLTYLVQCSHHSSKFRLRIVLPT